MQYLSNFFLSIGYLCIKFKLEKELPACKTYIIVTRSDICLFGSDDVDFVNILSVKPILSYLLLYLFVICMPPTTYVNS